MAGCPAAATGPRGLSSSELGDALWPHTKRYREPKEELLAVQKAVAAREDGAAKQFAAAKEEHVFANACLRSTEEFYLDIEP
ncbi:Sulfotransferase 16 [Hordeum vulgare]|nr:Sulfotransferase 16 [Hordeum vulgare]